MATTMSAFRARSAGYRGNLSKEGGSSMSIYVLLSIVTGAVIPPRPLLARRTISSGLSTPSPNAVRILRCSSSASPIAGRCIDSSEEGSRGFRCVEVRTLKNVDGVVVV